MRSLKGWLKISILIWGTAASLLHLYTSGFGTYEPRTQRGLHLLLLLPLIYILFPATKKSPKDRPTLLDVMASILCFLGPFYIVSNAERLNFRIMGIDEVLPVEIVLGSYFGDPGRGGRSPCPFPLDGGHHCLLYLLSGDSSLLAWFNEIQRIFVS